MFVVISPTTSPKLYRLYIHINREHAAYGNLYPIADAIASGGKCTCPCLATLSRTSLITLGRARTRFSSPLERAFAVLYFEGKHPRFWFSFLLLQPAMLPVSSPVSKLGFWWGSPFITCKAGFKTLVYWGYSSAYSQKCREGKAFLSDP